MEQTREVNIYEKTYLKKDGKTKFKKPYAIIGEKDGKAIIIEASLTSDCRKKMTKEEVETPCTLTLLNGNDKDYFIKKASYTNSKGEKGTKNVIVIMNYQTAKPFEMKSTSIEDLL